MPVAAAARQQAARKYCCRRRYFGPYQITAKGKIKQRRMLPRSPQTDSVRTGRAVSRVSCRESCDIRRHLPHHSQRPPSGGPFAEPNDLTSVGRNTRFAWREGRSCTAPRPPREGLHLTRHGWSGAPGQPGVARGRRPPPGKPSKRSAGKVVSRGGQACGVPDHLVSRRASRRRASCVGRRTLRPDTSAALRS